MIQRIFVTVDTKKTNYKNVGKINHGDDLILEISVLSDGNMLSFNNPMVDLLVKKSDGKMVRQTTGIELSEPNTFVVEVSKDCVTSPGLTTNQLIINDDGRISTCMFYYTVINSLEEDIIQSISNVEVLEQLDEYTIQIRDRMETLDAEVQDKLDELTDDIDKLEEEFSDTSANLIEAEAKRTEAELLRVQAESLRVQHEDERVESENVRDQNESDRATAESVREQQEVERILNDEERHRNEVSRNNLEDMRISNELNRIKSEKDRQSNETRREASERSRVNAENTRNGNETSRRNSETARISAESKRELAENDRKNAEAIRITNEQNRADIFDSKITEVDTFIGGIEEEISNCKTDYFGNEHPTLSERLNSDFANLHQRLDDVPDVPDIPDSSYLDYEGYNIIAYNTLSGYTRDMTITGRTERNALAIHSSVGDLSENFGGRYKVEVKSYGENESSMEDVKTYYLTEPLCSVPNGTADVITDNKLIKRVKRMRLTIDAKFQWYNYTYNIVDQDSINCRTNIFCGVLADKEVGYDNILIDGFTAVQDNDAFIKSKALPGLCSGHPSINSIYLCVGTNDNVTTIEDISILKEYLDNNEVYVHYQLVEPYEEVIDSSPLKLRTYDGETNIISTNNTIPYITAKIPSNVDAVVMNLRNGIGALQEEANEITDTTNDLMEVVLDQQVELTLLGLGV